MFKYFDYFKARLQKEFIKYTSNPIAKILTVHRVTNIDNRSVPAFNSLIVTPQHFETKIIEYKNNGFEFISISHLHKLLVNDEKLNNKIVLSIDDGYKDTYTNAFPILKKHEIPFTFYISSAFPDKKICLWWFYLNDLITEEKTLKLFQSKYYNINTIERKQGLYIKLSKAILNMGSAIPDKFQDMFNVEYQHIVDKYKKYLIDWEEITEMANNEYCTIGAHSENHFGQRFLTSSDIQYELKTNISKLESVTGKKVKHYAYPFGTLYSISPKHYLLSKKLGLDTAVTAFNSMVYPYHRKTLFSLPRVSFC